MLFLKVEFQLMAHHLQPLLSVGSLHFIIEKKCRNEFLNSHIHILESKMDKTIDFVLDSKKFGLNKECLEFSYFQSSLDILFEGESRVWSHCMLNDLYCKSLAMYIRTNKESKSRRPFDTSDYILVEKKKGQGYNRQLSRFQLLHECIYIYEDAFRMTKKEVWQVYYDPPKPRLLNAISSTSGLTM